MLFGNNEVILAFYTGPVELLGQNAVQRGKIELAPLGNSCYLVLSGWLRKFFCTNGNHTLLFFDEMNESTSIRGFADRYEKKRNI